MGQQTQMSQQTKKPIEEVIAETPYARDAFEFVQEGVGYAVEKIHGERTPDQQIVDHWMARTETPYDRLAEMYDDATLPSEVRALVDQAGGCACFNRHVSGAQLTWALRDMAVERWGRLAGVVLRRWGITKTEDFGKIVFAMVNNDYLQAQSTDNLRDFVGVYNFEEAFASVPIGADR